MPQSLHGAALGLFLMSSGCVTGAGLQARQVGVPEVGADRETPAYRISVTEPDATVATSLAPLVEAAGPAQLFVSHASVRCPSEMALVGGRVCVDRWEAHVVVREGGALRQRSPYLALDDVTGYRAASRPGVVPQGYVSGRQAERACRASGKRLCTAAEWELGCRGSKGGAFPYGRERRAKACNDDIRSRHPVIEAVTRAGLSPDQTWKEGMHLPLINQLDDSLLATGARPECVSEDGLFDMVGNLHEWVAEADGTFRGGYYMDTSKNGEGCSYQTTAHDFDYHDYSTGFRCCADPEPIE